MADKKIRVQALAKVSQRIEALQKSKIFT